MDILLSRTDEISVDGLPVFEKYKDHTYLYRYDLRKEDDDRYSFVYVQLKGYPNKNEVIKYLLRQLISLENELKIINDYNEVMLFTDKPEETEEYKTYKEYLAIRKQIKMKVTIDFINNNFK